MFKAKINSFLELSHWSTVFTDTEIAILRTVLEKIDNYNTQLNNKEFSTIEQLGECTMPIMSEILSEVKDFFNNEIDTDFDYPYYLTIRALNDENGDSIFIEVDK